MFKESSQKYSHAPLVDVLLEHLSKSNSVDFAPNNKMIELNLK